MVSDTHASDIDELSPEILDALRGVDLVVHAGDFTRRSVLEGLRRLGNFIGVHGNCDEAWLRKELPEKQVLDIAGKRVGITHGYGPPVGLEQRVAQELPGAEVIIYGHSHVPRCESIHGVLYFNPGTSGERFTAAYRSFGIITIGRDITGEIIRLR
ncbi:MAG: metallophosphoesterase family protein [Chloroflexota bacterium]